MHFKRTKRILQRSNPIDIRYAEIQQDFSRAREDYYSYYKIR